MKSIITHKINMNTCISFINILHQCEHAILSITYRSEKMYFEYHQIVLQSINSLLLHFGVEFNTLNKFQNKMNIF